MEDLWPVNRRRVCFSDVAVLIYDSVLFVFCFRMNIKLEGCISKIWGSLLQNNFLCKSLRMTSREHILMFSSTYIFRSLLIRLR